MQISVRVCKKCSVEQPLDNFWKHDTGGHRHECKTCYRKRMAEWRSQNLDTVKERSKRKYAQTRKDPEKYAKIRQRARINAKEWIARVRDEVYNAYGGAVCVCCGETERRFLTMDHINNDGHIHRKKEKWAASALYTYLRSHGFPPGYQVLCFNCNLGKARNKGVCPHKSRQEGSETIAQASTLK